MFSQKEWNEMPGEPWQAGSRQVVLLCQDLGVRTTDSTETEASAGFY